VFTIIFAGSKVYCCETDEIAASVRVKLEEFGIKNPFELTNDTHCIDFGGCIKMDAKPILIPGTNVDFFPHHYDFVCSSVRHAQKKEDGYYWVSAARACLLTPETFHVVKDYLRVNSRSLLEAQAAEAELLFESIAKVKRYGK